MKLASELQSPDALQELTSGVFRRAAQMVIEQMLEAEEVREAVAVLEVVAVRLAAASGNRCRGLGPFPGPPPL